MCAPFVVSARPGVSPMSVSCRQCDQIKIAKCLQSCPKMVSLEKLMILTPLQKLPKNGGDWGKLIVAKGFKKLSKV